MLEWSLSALRAVTEVKTVVIALPSTTSFSAPRRDDVIVVAGGATRSESVQAALAAAPDGDPVIVHDAARPLARPELFEQALLELAQSGADAVIAAAPVSDTIKQVADDGHTVTRTLERSRLWAVQTPQVFRRTALERALDVPPDVLASATDDAWLVERAGGVVRVTEAPPENIKVTTPADLRLAEMLLG